MDRRAETAGKKSGERWIGEWREQERRVRKVDGRVETAGKESEKGG